jgi:hypothetical protein
MSGTADALTRLLARETWRPTRAHIEGARNEIAALTARAEQAERERDRLIEDRARFPDRPDDVGRMIEAHIGNLKIGKEEAERHAREHMVKASAEIKRLRAYIWSLDGKTIAIRGEGNTFIDDGIIIAADVVREPEQGVSTSEDGNGRL